MVRPTCPTCGHSAKNKAEMIQHMDNHMTSKDDKVCLICAKGRYGYYYVYDKEEMALHEENNHKVKCDSCKSQKKPYLFVDLRAHLLQQHNEDVNAPPAAEGPATTAAEGPATTAAEEPATTAAEGPATTAAEGPAPPAAAKAKALPAAAKEKVPLATTIRKANMAAVQHLTSCHKKTVHFTLPKKPLPKGAKCDNENCLEEKRVLEEEKRALEEEIAMLKHKIKDRDYLIERLTTSP